MNVIAVARQSGKSTTMAYLTKYIKYLEELEDSKKHPLKYLY